MEITHQIELLRSDVEMLRQWARRVNSWAKESGQGWWSTHQVDANYALAAEMHRHADELDDRRLRLLEEARDYEARDYEALAPKILEAVAAGVDACEDEIATPGTQTKEVLATKQALVDEITKAVNRVLVDELEDLS